MTYIASSKFNYSVVTVLAIVAPIWINQDIHGKPVYYMTISVCKGSYFITSTLIIAWRQKREC